MSAERITPLGTQVVHYTDGFDVKSLLCKRHEIPLSMDCACRVTLSLEIGKTLFSFVERTTCGARDKNCVVPDGSKKGLDLLRNVLRSIGIEPNDANMDSFFPEGLPSFDVMERIAQWRQQGHAQAGPGGVLV